MCFKEAFYSTSALHLNVLFLSIVCSSVNSTNGYQCKCEENYAWSKNTCLTHEACDAIIGSTCGCINTLQLDGLYCQPNTSQIGKPGFMLSSHLLASRWSHMFTKCKSTTQMLSLPPSSWKSTPHSVIKVSEHMPEEKHLLHKNSGTCYHLTIEGDILWLS